MIEVRVHESVFAHCPSFRRGIVIAKHIDNQGRSAELESMLQNAVTEEAENPIDLKSDLRAVVWSEAHRRFSSNPNKFPPPHCALLKRVRKSGIASPGFSILYQFI